MQIKKFLVFKQQKAHQRHESVTYPLTLNFFFDISKETAASSKYFKLLSPILSTASAFNTVE